MTSDDADPMTAVVHAVQDVLDALGADHRRVADGEWGLSLEVGGWPLHVGLAVRDGFLGARAEALAPGRVEAATLLHLNRRGALVRYATSAAGAVWVQGEVPVRGIEPETVDALLARLVDAAERVRAQAAAESPPPA